MQTVKVKPWGMGQGDFVIVNRDDFNPKMHDLYEPDVVGQAPTSEFTAKALRVALDDKGIKYPASASTAELQALLDAGA